MKRRVTSIAVALALILSVFTVGLRIPKVSATDPQITGMTAYSLGEYWDKPKDAIDGNKDTNWHTQHDGWGVIFLDLGKTYKLSSLEIDFPDNYFKTASKIEVGTFIELPDNIQGDIIKNDAGSILNAPAKSVVYENNSLNSNVTGNVTGTARYLRFKMTDTKNGLNTDGNAKISEIRIFGAEVYAGATDPKISGMTAYALGNYWDPPKNAIDNDKTTNWHTQFQGWGVMFLDLGKIYDISALELDFPDNYFKSASKIEVGTFSELPDNIEDDIIKNDAGLILNAPAESVVYENNSLSGNIATNVAKTARYLRFKMTDTNNDEHTDGNAKISEIRLFGKPNVAEDNAKLASVLINGSPLPGFKPEKVDYTMALPASATSAKVVATPQIEGVAVTYENITGSPFGKSAKINTTALDGTTKLTYTINFVKSEPIKISKIYSLVGAYDSAKYLIDGDTSTQWHAFFEWGCLYIDLGKEYDLSIAELFLPSGYPGSGKKISIAVDSINSFPGVIDDDVIIDPNDDYGSIMKLPYVERLYEGEISGSDTLELSGTARYLRIQVGWTTSSEGANAKLTEIKLSGTRHVTPDLAALKEISVDGVKIPEFDESILSYIVDIPAKADIPVVFAKALSDGMNIKITQATAEKNFAEILVRSEDQSKEQTYTVYFAIKDEKTSIVSHGKKAVGLGKEGIPGYVLDGDRNTAWLSGSSTGTVFIDLKGLYKITRMQTIFAEGSSENWKFKIDVLSAMPKYSGKYTDDNGDSLVVETIYDGTKGLIAGNEVPILFKENIEGRYIRLTIDKNTSMSSVGLREWLIYGYSIGTNDTELQSMSIDGKDIPGFGSTIQRYYVDLPYGTEKAPQVTATAKDIGAEVIINQANSPNGTAVIKVTSSDSSKVAEYEVRFITFGEDEEILSLDKKVKANSSQNDYPASNANYGKQTTSWRPVKELNTTYTWQVDLEETYSVTRVYNQFYDHKSSDEYNMVIDGSIDGVQWYRVYNSHEDKEFGNNVNMQFNAVMRYVRLSYFGVSGYYGDPVSVSEVTVYGTEFVSLIESVSIDSEIYKDFREDVMDYIYTYQTEGDKIPQAHVKIKDGVKLDITQALSQNGNIEFTASKDDTTRSYVIQLHPVGSYLPVPPSTPEHDSKLPEGNTPKTEVGFTMIPILLSSVASLLVFRSKIKKKTPKH